MPYNSMVYNTYTFSEIAFTMAHPSLGQLQLVGESVGNIVFAYAQDANVMAAAHDGSVQHTKVVTRHGTMSLTLHQNSRANEWMKKAYNYCMQSYAMPDWAQFNGRVESPTTREVVTFSETAFHKRPDISYQQNGQEVTWAFDCGIINIE